MVNKTNVQAAPTTISIPKLRKDFKDRVIAPGDPDYDKARTVFYGGVDRHPAVIIKVADANDVSRVVNLARESGLELAVRSGGHSIVGHSVTEGGIVLDLSNMKDLQIDPESRTAWAETGLTAGEVTTAVAAAWTCCRVWRHRIGRDRRAHVGWRRWLPRPQIRSHHRQFAGGGSRNCRWTDSPRGRADSPGPLLGDPRRRRQLRRGHPFQVPPARGALRCRRHAHPARHSRNDRWIYCGIRGCT